MSRYRRRVNDDNAVIWITFGIIAAFFLGVFVLDRIAKAQINKILAEDPDPAATLILALDHWNPLMRENAEDTLNEIGDPLLVTLAPVCDGVAVDAKAYDPSAPGPHTLVFASGSTTHDWTYKFLEDYGPVSRDPADVELVACVAKGVRHFGACDFESGAKRSRNQLLLSIDIYEAATGKLIQSITLEGSEPRDCPPFQLLSNSNTIYGSRIKEKDVRAILEEYFN